MNIAQRKLNSSISWRRDFAKNKWMYIFSIPIVVFLFVFCYIPMFGVIISFQDFKFLEGFSGSPWLGLQHFLTAFESSKFWQVLRNSLVLNLIRLFTSFPAPIILALCLNEVRSVRFKRIAQTVVYLPHFISMVVVVSLAYNLLNSSTGLVNQLIKSMGGTSIGFLDDARYFRGSIVGIGIWKEMGWGTIIYLSAISGVDVELYDAAQVDGAGRLRRIWHVTLPGIRSTVIVMLVLRMGSLLNNGFEMIFLLYNSFVYDVADVFETYTYRLGVMEGRFSYTTAVGLFKSVVAFILVMTANWLSRKVNESSIF